MCTLQVQVYWSESPKAKFVKQGEVEQVNIILNVTIITENIQTISLTMSTAFARFFHLHLQVSFTAKLTVSDKKVKWSFQDQVSTTFKPKPTDHNSHPF